MNNFIVFLLKLSGILFDEINFAYSNLLNKKKFQKPDLEWDTRWVRETYLTSNKNADSDEDESNGLGKQSEVQVQILYIMPPNDGAVTDEDSGEEDHVHTSNASSTQLTALAVIGSSQLQDSADDVERDEEKDKVQSMEGRQSPRKIKFQFILIIHQLLRFHESLVRSLNFSWIL